MATLDDAREIPVASAEDTVLAKLQWFRRGGEVSERQWTDVVGLLRVVGALDHAYLRSRAPRRGVTNLLDRAWADAGKSLRRDGGSSPPAGGYGTVTTPAGVGALVPHAFDAVTAIEYEPAGTGVVSRRSRPIGTVPVNDPLT